MLISEKQIIKLLNLARTHSEKLKTEGIQGETLSYMIDSFLMEIQEQQSEELKEIE